MVVYGASFPKAGISAAKCLARCRRRGMRQQRAPAPHRSCRVGAGAGRSTRPRREGWRAPSPPQTRKHTYRRQAHHKPESIPIGGAPDAPQSRPVNELPESWDQRCKVLSTLPPQRRAPAACASPPPILPGGGWGGAPLRPRREAWRAPSPPQRRQAGGVEGAKPSTSSQARLPHIIIFFK